MKQRRLRLEYVIWRNEKAPNNAVSKNVEKEREREGRRGGEGNLRNIGIKRTISNWFSGSINRTVY